MKYINADKIRTEIERLIHSIENCPFIIGELGQKEREIGEVMAYKDILSFLDTLEETVSEDVNDEIKRYIEEYGYERGEDKLLIAIVARHFAEWGAEHLHDSSDDLEEAE